MVKVVEGIRGHTITEDKAFNEFKRKNVTQLK